MSSFLIYSCFWLSFSFSSFLICNESQYPFKQELIIWPSRLVWFIYYSCSISVPMCFVSRAGKNEQFLGNIISFPLFRMYFVIWNWQISLQMAKFLGNQVPKFPTFSRHVCEPFWHFKIDSISQLECFHIC